MNNKAFALPLWIIISALLVGGAIYLGYIDIASVVSGGTFVKPSWARLECAPSDDIKTNSEYLSSTKLFKCSANTESCNFEIQCEGKDRGLFGADNICTGNYKECDLNGNSCGSQVSYSLTGNARKTIPALNNGKSYLFSGSAGSINSFDYTRVNSQYNPWKLYRFVGGNKQIVNSFDCTLRSGDLSKVRAEDFVGNTLNRNPDGEGSRWVNYVDDWNYGPATNIVRYNGQEAYCSGAKVYSIIKLQMADGQLVKVDPTYRGSTQSGDQLSGLGSVIANVECCPNEPSCGDDFKYVNADSPSSSQNTRQCFTDIQCFNAGGPVPIGSYQYVKYSCVSGTCQKSNPVTVECTSNAQCQNGEICDLSTLNYGKCITQNTGVYCGDGICQLGESASTCSQDCELTCPPGETLVKTTSSNNLICKISFGLVCEEKTVQYCTADPEPFPWATIGVIAVIVVVAFLLIKFRKAIPVIGGYLP